MRTLINRRSQKLALSEPILMYILDLVNEHNLPGQNSVFCTLNRVEDIILFVLVQTAGH